MTDARRERATVAPAPAEAGGWIRRMLPFLAVHRARVAVAFGASLAGMAVAGLTPVAQKVIVDDVILERRRSAVPWLALLVAAGLFRFGAAFVRRYVGGRVALDVQHDLRTAIYDRLQRLDFARHDELRTGQLVSRATSDVALVQAVLAFLPLTTGNVVLLVVAVVAMLALSPLLTVVMAVVVPGIVLLTMRLRTTVFPASWDAQQKAAEVAGVVEEAVSGVRVVKGFGQESRELDRLAAAARALYGSRLRVVRMQAFYASTLQALPTFGLVGILALGGWLASQGRISIGTFVAFSSYLLQLVSPVRMFSLVLTAVQQARAGSVRILELLDSTPVVTERPGAVDLVVRQGGIELDDVTFGYLRSEPVLRGFTLSVAPGETVALVGPSGSGKSTVSLLLPRLYDVQGGAVRVDGTDVRDVTLDSLRRSIGVVFEESFLFSDTVRANIAYGRPDATDEEVEAAARAAEAHEFVMALAHGYDTVVGERGITLSGGQRQRVALARALVTDPRVLVLDDATSSVDAGVEEEIHATLRRLMAGRTTLLVAHRRSTLRLADRVAVVDGGRVVDVGTHEELLVRSALYRALLAGPGGDCEGELDPAAARAGSDDGPAGDGRAWRPAGGPGEVPAAARRAALDATVGMGLGRIGLGHGAPHGGGGLGHIGQIAMLASPADVAERLADLAPADDDPGVDAVREAAHDPVFTLRRFVHPYRRPLLAGLALVVFDSLATLAGPALVRTGIDRGVVQGSTRALWLATLAFLAVTIANWADVWAQTRHTGRTAERMLFALRVRIFAHLQRLSVDYYDRERAGRIMTRMTTDVEALASLLQNGIINAAVNLVGFLGVAVVLVVLNPPLSLATFSIVPPLVVATVWFRRRAGRAYTEARDRMADVNANLQESLSGVRVAQAFVREERNGSDFRAVAGEYLDARLRAQRLVATYFPFVELLSSLAVVAVLGTGAWLAGRGGLTPGAVVAFLLYLDQLFSPIQHLSHVFDTYEQARASLTKIGELMATPTSTPVPEHPVDPGPLRGAVRFEGVRFRYPGASVEALRGVDLDIAPGDTVALVGETGAGKSTIVKLVARFYDPTEGRVLVDGLPLTELDPTAYRRQLGYVPQEPFLFSGTIRDNIAYGRADATDAEVEAAARAVGAHELVASLPGGYLSQVSEGGRALSAGQRQLIALARARLVDPRILLLDEATSNLDLATEARVAHAMGQLSRGRTTLVVAHRLQTAMRADRIVVVDGGRVVEQGTHAELVARGGRYAQLWRAFALEAQPA